MRPDEWDRSTNVEALLRALQGEHALSARKTRLFWCACVRSVWPLLSDARSRQAVEAAERVADGLATVEALANDAGEAWVASGGPALFERAQHAATAAALVLADPCTLNRSIGVVSHALSAGATGLPALLREVAGNPFRPLGPVPVSRTASSIAARIYEERDWSALLILADALEDLGCDASALAHLRGPGTHVRGCHVLDAILARE